MFSLRRSDRRLWRLAAAAAIVAVAVSAAGCRDGAMPADSPDGTVQSFLVNAVVDGYGFGACRYLSARARVEVSAAEPPHSSCEDALSDASLTLGRDQVNAEGKVKRLAYSVQEEGNAARVTVRASGGAVTFGLRRASRAELDEFQAPSTPWRIDTGVDALLTHVS